MSRVILNNGPFFVGRRAKETTTQLAGAWQIFDDGFESRSAAEEMIRTERLKDGAEATHDYSIMDVREMSPVQITTSPERKQ